MFELVSEYAPAGDKPQAIAKLTESVLAGVRLKFRPPTPAPPPVQLGAAFDPARIVEATAKFLAVVRSAALGQIKLPKV